MKRQGKSIAAATKMALCILTLQFATLCAQNLTAPPVEVRGRVELPKRNGSEHGPAIVVWLNPVDHSSDSLVAHPGRFKLVQKNRMFTPHLLVIPVGSVVIFPNQDPFFHNVFSLFNGKRFDLGLYEAGSSKEEVFSRQGVSYIFCNIHPEMSAVVVTLSTSLYAVANSSGEFSIHQVPLGDYEMEAWIEGTPQPALDQLSRTIHIQPGDPAALTIDASNIPHTSGEHLNKFGKPYDRDTRPAY